MNGKDKYTQTEFYMRRQDRAYFRNEHGKLVLHQCDSFPYNYGQKYDLKLVGLVR